jgi:hypothetical protein
MSEEEKMVQLLERILDTEERRYDTDRHILETGECTNDLLKEIARLLRQKGNAAQSLTLTFKDLKGNILMPATLSIGQTATAIATEWSGPNGTGSPLAAAGPIAFSSSDATIATVDPASGLVTAVGPGTATITGTDSTNGLSGSDVVSDSPITAQSLTVVVTANAAGATPAVRRA